MKRTQDKVNLNKNYYLKFQIMIAIFLVLLAIIVIAMGLEKGRKAKGASNISNDQPQVSEDEIIPSDSQVTGVIKEIDSLLSRITIYDIENDEDLILNFTGGSQILGAYDQPISISQLELGEIINASYKKANLKLAKLEVSKDAWEYQGVINFNFNTSKKALQIGDRLYQYQDSLLIESEGEFISLIDLNKKDELTVKGIGNKVYSIQVIKGHGYIRFTNYEAFYGGTVEVGYDTMLPVSEDMLLVAREGDYRVTLENGEVVGSKMVRVLRDREIVLDMSEYKVEASRVGKVNFVISPEGSDLYINGGAVDYTEPISLNFGEHTVKVEFNGYTTYTGILTVNQSYSNVYINLAVPGEEGNSYVEGNDNDYSDNQDDFSSVDNDNYEEPDYEDNDSDYEDSDYGEPDYSGEEDNLVDTDNSNETSTSNKTDKKHKIYIQKPEKTEVYWNGKYKGTTPVSFTKEIGTHTITLRRDGYETKSYTVEVIDDSEDVQFSFPNMLAK